MGHKRRRNRRGWCVTGRRRLKSESEAIDALLSVQNRRSGGRIERRYYSCSKCNGWHLTGQD